MRRGRIVRRADVEIEPDEVLLDASNIPHFDQSQFQGRIIAPIEKRSIMLFGVGAVLLFGLLLAEAFHLQVHTGTALALQSEQNRLEQSVVFARRGIVFDRNGEVLIDNAKGDEEFEMRSYRSPGFGHVLGYVSYPQKDRAGFYFSTDIEGVVGVESVHNEALGGENGLFLRETDALGEERSGETVLKALPGENVTLSLDARIQESMHEHIKELADSIPFRGGAGVVMDVTNGEILALTNYPEYDPNVLAAGDDREVIASYQQDTRTPFLNRVVSGLFTPGSIVKPLVALAALDEGVVDERNTFLSAGQISIPNPYVPSQPSIFRDWKVHGYVNVIDALAVSSNIFFYIVGGGFEGQQGLGIDRISRWYELFGLTSATGINLPSEEVGVVPTPAWKEEVFGEDWRIGDTYFTAIGQYGLQVTPLQMVRAIGALANNGTLLTPTLVQGEVGLKESVSFSDEARDIVVSGMRKAVEDGEVGTARGLSNTHVSVAAKTGTAQVGVGNQFHNAWVGGFFPIENPRYAFVLVMDHGPSENLIGAVSVMRNVIEDMAVEAPEYFTVDE